MLKGIDPLLSSDLLGILRDMGHGDRIALADANFPAHFLGPPCIRLDVDVVTAGRAILSLLPLDGFIDDPVARMEIDNFRSSLNEAHEAFAAMIEESAGPDWPMGSFERLRFYEEASSCVATIHTLERRPYANFILTKGVLDEQGEVVRPPRPKSASKRPPAGHTRRR